MSKTKYITYLKLRFLNSSDQFSLFLKMMVHSNDLIIANGIFCCTLCAPSSSDRQKCVCVCIII